MNKYQAAYENECMALGCFLHEPSLLEETHLLPVHFLEPKNKKLFKIMLSMRKEGEEVNFLTLSHLGDSESLKFGGISTLADLMNMIPDANRFETYQQNILDFHTIQQAQSMANTFLDSTKERHNVKELSKLISDVTKLEATTVRNKSTFKGLLVDRVQEHYSSPTQGLSGVNTGFTGLNRFTDGWQKSDLIIVAARPSMGKTALVLNSLLNGCKKDEVYGTLFSIEMAKGQIVDRLIAMEAGINLMKMRNPNKTFTDGEWGAHSVAVGKLETLSLDIRDEFTVPGIRAALRKNMKEHPNKKHVAAIDFLTLIKHQDPSGNTHKDLSDIVRELKQVCKDLNIPIITLAQLNRGVEARQDKRPNMSDIGESGTIEQIADLIAFLYREEYYSPDCDDSQKGITEIIIAKNRNGSTGTVKMKFKKETNTFYDVYLT